MKNMRQQAAIMAAEKAKGMGAPGAMMRTGLPGMGKPPMVGAGPAAGMPPVPGMINPMRKDGGAIMGGKAAKIRMDRPKRAAGGKVDGKKGKTNVNIIIAPHGDGPAAGAAMPVPVAAAPPTAPMPPKPPMMMPPGAGGPPGMPQGLPGMHAKGGRIRRASGGKVDGDDPGYEQTEKSLAARKSGGRVKFDAGAGSGEGRLEKIGKKP